MTTDYYRAGLGAGIVSMLMRLALPISSFAMLYALCHFYGINRDGSFEVPYLALSIVAPLLAFIFTEQRNTEPSRLLTSGWRVAERTATAWIMVVAALLLIGYLADVSSIFSRRTLVTWFVLTPAASVAMHIGLRSILRRIVANQGTKTNVVIAGVNDVSRRLATSIAAHPDFGHRVVGFFDDRSRERLGDTPDLPLLGQLRDLPDFARRSNVDTIYISIPLDHDQRIHELLDQLKDTTASIYFVPDIFVFDLIQSRTDEIGGVPVVALCESPFYGTRAVLKRLSDIVLASGMLVLAAPLMLAIAIALRLTSSQSVLFKQRRYGLGGEEILVYKFRTMTVSDDGHKVAQATENDARVTRIGQILRRYSLDELPQIINVLEGKMSVIGPRPHAVAHNEEYRRLIKGYMVRHKVTPGITGLAQVNGCRGETATVEDMAKRVHFDLQYLREWSFALDMKILWRTALIVLKRTNAY